MPYDDQDVTGISANNPALAAAMQALQGYQPDELPTPTDRKGALSNYTNAIRNAGKDTRQPWEVMLEAGLSSDNPADPFVSGTSSLKALKAWNQSQRESVAVREQAAAKAELEDVLQRRKDAQALLLGQSRAGNRGTWQTKTLDDGSVYRWNTGTGEEKFIPATMSKAWQAAQLEGYKRAGELRMPNPEEYAANYADQVVGSAPRQPNPIRGATAPGTQPAAPANQTLGVGAQQRPAIPAQGMPPGEMGGMPQEGQLDLGGAQGVEALPDGVQAEIARLVNRLQANPSPELHRNTMQRLYQLQKQYGGAQVPTVGRRVLNYDNVAKFEGKAETEKASAKNYAALFDENVAKPAAAFTNTGKIMQDFNQLGQMKSALKAGKLKEYMAGDGGKWALSLLPPGSDLSKGIANAQEAEKLTAGLVNQILMAAKGVQTEGDAQRAKSQIPSVGMSDEANKYIESYVTETARQLKLRERIGLEHKNATGSFEGYDDVWTSSPIMTKAKGSVKKVGSNFIGLTQYLAKYREKYPDRTEEDAINSWNKVN